MDDERKSKEDLLKLINSINDENTIEYLYWFIMAKFKGVD